MPLTGAAAADAEDFKEISETEFQKVQSKTTKIGYADGAVDGREVVFQPAFDRGYADGLRTGFELEKVKAFYKNLTTAHSEEFHKERLKYNELQVQETSDNKHFQYIQHKENDIDAASKAQQKYVDDILGKCEQNLPMTMNLLGSQKKH